MGPAAKDAVPALVRSLGVREPEVRFSAVKALAQIGPAAKEALPALKRLAEEDVFLQQIVEMAIKEIDR